jgi:hypothetical protein
VANGKRFTLGDTAVFYSMDKAVIKTSDAIYKAKKYMWYPRSLWGTSKYPSLIKYMDPVRTDNTTDAKATRGGRSVFVARLAETYLIAAEAYARKTVPDYTKAVAYINKIRDRAAYKVNEVRPWVVFTVDGEVATEDKKSSSAKMAITINDINTTAKMVNFILDERARELCGELHRWYDLVRTETLVARATLYNPQAALGIKSFHVLRPIPQKHIDLNIGTAPDQNTGY